LRSGMGRGVPPSTEVRKVRGEKGGVNCMNAYRSSLIAWLRRVGGAVVGRRQRRKETVVCA